MLIVLDPRDRSKGASWVRQPLMKSGSERENRSIKGCHTPACVQDSTLRYSYTPDIYIYIHIHIYILQPGSHFLKIMNWLFF
jgi:hypothetical protein